MRFTLALSSSKNRYLVELIHKINYNQPKITTRNTSLMIATGFSKIRTKHALYLYIVLCICFTSPYTYARPTLKICHEARNYPPYIYQEENQVKGLLTDIIKTAAENAIVAVQFDAKPWNRCQRDVKAGNSHALFAMIKTPLREQEYAFPNDKNGHLWTATYPFFIKQTSTFSQTDYLPNKGLGAPLGYVVWQELNQRGWLSPFQYDPELGLNMVAQGKLDGYVVERLIGLHLLNESQLSDFVKPSIEQLLDAVWYLPFNKRFYKKNTHLVQQIWHEIDGAREQLKDKFNTH